jgi:Ca2+-transporting ATPase
MESRQFQYDGLTDKQVLEFRLKHGVNRIDQKKRNSVLESVLGVITEPMFLLLLVATSIYFLLGKWDDGFFMLSAIALVSVISIFQESRSKNALAALKKLTQPYSTVIRNGQSVQLLSEEIVLGDYIIVEEGSSIPADGVIKKSNDFSVNESILTGESLSVTKNEIDEKNNHVFQGTTVVSGLAICEVTAIGNNTQLGKIGKSIELIKEQPSPLQIQIANFVKKMALIGVVVFLIVWIINFVNSNNFLDSLLKSLTLAMSILPEEIPVAYTTFIAVGAWRLMKLGIIVKETKTIETLGSSTIICIDKTGTITENKMSLARLFVSSSGKICAPSEKFDNESMELIRMAMWSSEPIPFDPLEIAIHNSYEKSVEKDERMDYNMIHEYPLEGRPPMMTHIFENAKGNRIIATKGAPEAILKVSKLDNKEKKEIEKVIDDFSHQGFRVLAVATTEFEGDKFYEKQQDFTFRFLGLIGFYDPPKSNIKEVLGKFYQAGVQVKILTGDNAPTTLTIAQQVGFKGDSFISGEELMKLKNSELLNEAIRVNIFTRMFPDAKLRIVNALKENGEIVAMTGDGVNDGPALKAAHIGIAMGSKGSEIAKRASSLILIEDDLAKMVDAIAMGRKIYLNLKKAIQYIISIHIPIILTVLLPLAFGWLYPTIFSPVHVIFLELIMGPTCSIIYENEPLEENLMSQRPRPFTKTFFNFSELTASIVQGLTITLGALFIYQYSVTQLWSENTVRTMVFIVLVSANIFLTLINRSQHYSILKTLFYKNHLVPLIIGITIMMIVLILLIPQFCSFFEFEALSFKQLIYSITIGFISVIWFEFIKWRQRLQRN